MRECAGSATMVLASGVLAHNHEGNKGERMSAVDNRALDFNIPVEPQTRWPAGCDDERAFEVMQIARGEAAVLEWFELLRLFGSMPKQRPTAEELRAYGSFQVFVQGILEEMAERFRLWTSGWGLDGGFGDLAVELGASPSEVLGWVRDEAVDAVAGRDDLVAYYTAMVPALADSEHPLVIGRRPAEKWYLLGRALAVHALDELPLIDFRAPGGAPGIPVGWIVRIPDFEVDGQWDEDEMELQEVWGLSFC